MADQPADQNFPATLPPDGSVQPSHVSAEMGDQNSGRVVHAIFIGPDGLRAGWRLLIYILLTIACLKGVGMVLHAFGLHAPKTAAEVTPINMAWSRAAQFLCFLLPAFVMSKIERRPAGDYGLPARGAFGKEFWEGAAVGFVSLSLLLVLMRAFGGFYFGSVALAPKEALFWAAAWGLGFL